MELVEEVNPHVIFITETWLCNDIPDAHLGLSDYIIFRKDRANGTQPHGGVMIAVKSCLNPRIIENVTECEVMFLNIHINQKSVRLGVVYRPPSYSMHQDTQLLYLLRVNLESEMDFCVFGDFNYPCVDWETVSPGNNREHSFIDVINELNITQKVKFPTRDRNLLDLCLSSHSDLVTNVEVHETFSTSDHSYITCDLNISNPPEVCCDPCFNFKEADWEMMRCHLATIDWENMFDVSSGNFETFWLLFKNTLVNLTDLYVPTFIPTHRQSPWVDRRLKCLIRTKKRRWDKYKKSRNPTHLVEYRIFCKHVKKKVEEARSIYEKKKFNNRKKDAKQFFNYIDRRTKRKDNVPTLLVDDTVIIDDFLKAKTLSDQYESVFTIDNGIDPHVNPMMPPNSLCDIIISDHDVIKAIQSMNSNSAPGPDRIHSKLIINVYPYLVQPLKLLFQQSILTNKLPNDWKTGIITPVYKNNGKPANRASYRPICLTSVICKLLERILSNKLKSYLLTNHIISEEQHGFLNKRSTMTNMLNFFNDVTNYIDNKSKVDVIYIDLEKAFDTVSHQKLLLKLRSIGIGGNFYEWLKDFLIGRRQCVKVNFSSSAYVDVISGIPQGTILGPLLFLLFVNEVPSLCRNSSIKLYADDLKMYRRIDSTLDGPALQEDLDRILHFFTSWQLRVNPSKTETLHIGAGNPKIPYVVNGTIIVEAQNCKDLGFFVSNDISFSKYYSVIIRSSSFRIRQFKLSFVSGDRFLERKK